MAPAESSMNERAAASSVMSTSCAWTVPSTRSASASSRSRRRAPALTAAPSLTRASTVASPIPDEAPVTTRLLSLQRAGHGYGPGVAGSTAASAATSSASRIAAPSSALDSART